MHDQPSVSELVSAVKHFIDETASPNLTGHAAFHARVASNVLAVVLRDLAARPINDAAEVARLQYLLGADNADLSKLNAMLSERINTSDITAETPGLLDHLKRTSVAQLRVDQPHYSSLKDV